MKLNELAPWNWGRKKESDGALSVQNFLDRFWRGPFDSDLMSLGSFLESPRVEVNEDEKEVVVRVEMPGMEEKDISVDHYNGTLRIRGEKKNEKNETKKGYHYSECSYGSFNRSVPIPDAVLWDKAKAKYRKGVLHITLPKDEKRSSNRIEINVQ